jgi:hypothetical protein
MQQEVEGEISFKELLAKLRVEFSYLKSKWIVIVVIGLAGAGLGYYYASRQQKIYTATFSFALEDEKGSGGGGGSINGLASQFGFDLGGSAGGAFSGPNLTELMKSRSLVVKSLLGPVNVNGKQISLAEYFIEFNGMRKAWEGVPEYSGIQFPPNVDPATFSLAQNKVINSIYQQILNTMLTVGPRDKKVSIIYIDVASINELFAKYFAESVAAVVSDFYIDTKSKKAKMNVAILQSQADSIRGALNASMFGAAAANDNTFNLNPALNVKRVASSRKQVDVQANTAMLVQIVQNLEMAKVALRKETPLIQPIDTPILPLPFERANKVKAVMSGGMLAGIFIVVLLLGRRWWRKLTA